MDATLNMAYLERLHDPGHLTRLDYSKALTDIRHAAIFDYMQYLNYKIYNLSPFRVKNSEPIDKQEFLTLPPEQMFMYFSFWSCISRDVLWNYRKYFPGHKDDFIDIPSFANEKLLNEGKLLYNSKLLDSVPAIPEDTTVKPRFVYAHFFMPHYPYFYDENGQKYADTAIYNIKLIYNDQKFISYIRYTNKKIAAMLDKLLLKTGRDAIIIIQSDHGYRGFAKKNINDHFRNLSAIYFPDHLYGNLNDSMTNVNTFRILLNKYFDAKMPVLADSCVVLKD